MPLARDALRSGIRFSFANFRPIQGLMVGRLRKSVKVFRTPARQGGLPFLILNFTLYFCFLIFYL